MLSEESVYVHQEDAYPVRSPRVSGMDATTSVNFRSILSESKMLTGAKGESPGTDISMSLYRGSVYTDPFGR